ncbi:MAG: carboxypeptidase regulatory-like domain-containing protein [Elusimicrobia bacterium]|nr:carboxypeptidase regulatory-like domain-containing protein [Elusimicrobiota bacterium]
MPADAGLSLIELSLSMAVMGFLVMGTVLAFQWGLRASLSARRQMAGNNLLQSIHTRLLNMDFYNVFAVNTNNPNFGLWAAYPERTALTTLLQSAQNVGFTGFTIDVTFMRRDLSDANGNGLTTDLVPFADANGDGVDDFDPNIRFYDQNGDGDFYDRYGPANIPEQPDTHIKKLDIVLFKGNAAVASRKDDLLSLEQFSGTESASSEAAFSLRVDNPDNTAILYRALTPAQTNALNLPIAKSFPVAPTALRADAGAALVFTGHTEPSATVQLHLTNASTGTALDSTVTDTNGDFNFSAPNLTGQLVEGRNRIYALTVKGSGFSPYVIKELVLDGTPPAFTGAAPTGTVKTRSPHVGILFRDATTATTTVSGIAADALTFVAAGTTVAHRFEAATGKLACQDATTYLPPTFADGENVTVRVEGGDNAHYKSSHTWTFHVDIDDNDDTPPVVLARQPLGAGASTIPTIACRLADPDSGIVPRSLVLTVDGTVVLSSSTALPLGLGYDAESGTLSYTPTVPYAAGSFHTVRVHADHWAETPAAAANRTLDPATDPAAEWSFTCAP